MWNSVDNDAEEKKSVEASKKLDKNRKFSATKVRATIDCDSCGAPRAIYSDYAVGSTRGPSKQQLTDLMAYLRAEFDAAHRREFPYLTREVYSLIQHLPERSLDHVTPAASK